MAKNTPFRNNQLFTQLAGLGFQLPEEASEAVPTAPYNFVRFSEAVLVSPLNKYVVEAKENSNSIQDAYTEYLYSNPTVSGYFNVEVNNETPLYIGGQKDNFFSIGGKLCIPGSSFRGCIKNIFKIVTASAFRCNKENPDVYDRQLYFRSFASPHEAFKNHYIEKISQKRPEAGFLVRKDDKYYIYPAEYTPEKLRGSRYANCMLWNNKGVDVYTGIMQGKKHYYKITPKYGENGIINLNDDANSINVPDDIILDYIDDKSRKGLNLLDERNGKDKTSFKNFEFLKDVKYDYVVPCFYSANSDAVTSFGSGPYYRIPYENSIGKHIPDSINNSDIIDFTDAVFGRKEYWGSRVFFDDLYLEKDPETNKSPIKPLMTPNPTSFQNYLQSDDNNIAQHWDNMNASLRGYKMYWHRNPDWKGITNKNIKLDKQINPIEDEVKFSGRIRFENLTAEELGALALVLNLCKVNIVKDERQTNALKIDCSKEDTELRFKLGMGKPLGMGSVRITNELFVKSNDYYSSLFKDKNFMMPTPVILNEVITNYMEKFIYSINQFSKDNLNSYYDSIRELQVIMNISYKDRKSWNNDTRYMNILDKEVVKEVVNPRIPLPLIDDVVKQKK